MLENVLVYPGRPVLIVFVDNQPAYPLPIVAVLCIQVHWQSAKCKFVRKNEDKSYVTYLVAAPGFQCIARDKYSKDLSPSETHDQLQVYVHVMDALAGSVDQSLVSVLNPCKESCQNPYRQSHTEPWSSIFLVQHVFCKDCKLIPVQPRYSGTVCRYGLRNFTAEEPFYVSQPRSVKVSLHFR